jgi:superfamily II DNA/RNA helicase
LMELYGLVSIIDDYSFGDQKSFRTQYSRVTSTADADAFNELKERLKPICKRTLRRQVLEYIRYTNRIALVEEFYPTEEEQRLYDLVSNYLQSENLYALPASQRKLMTLILRKLLASSTYAISYTLEALANKLEGIIAAENPVDPETNIQVNFETYDELQDEWDDEEDPKDDDHYTPEDIENIKAEIKALKEFETLAKSIRKNSKGEKLFTALEKGFNEMERLGAPKKAIIFTESTRTQVYLRNILEARGFSGRVVLFNGSNNDPKSREIYAAWIERHKNTDKITGSRTADMRAALVDYFRDEASIMIATEAAAEGINLQFCSFVINYDMPWNPQRIEQRIGRCHRYGQKYHVVVVNFLNKANAADERVYQLLRDKFKLFDGVFGASDEVLGSIENGVDFEKRIAKIYQECKTAEEIQRAFDQLQADLEENISDAMQQTRKKLLENFDEEVHEKLRINLQESKEYLNRYEAWLWNISKYYLNSDADFSVDQHSFTLKRNPFPNATIHSGPYRIGKSVDDANVYRIGHPLAQQIIERCKSASLQPYELIFDYSNSGKIISTVAGLVGKSGYFIGNLLSINSLEVEEFIQLYAIDDENTILDKELCERFFSLPASINEVECQVPEDVMQCLSNKLTTDQNTILENVGLRNAQFFETELDKLDHWGEDRRNSLKVTLKELDQQIKEIKREARIAPNLPEKLKLEKERKKLEAERDAAWKEYDGAAKEIEQNKDALIDQVEKRLKQDVKEERLFLFKWKII